MKDKLELQKQYIEVKNKYDELSEKYWSESYIIREPVEEHFAGNYSLEYDGKYITLMGRDRRYPQFKFDDSQEDTYEQMILISCILEIRNANPYILEANDKEIIIDLGIKQQIHKEIKDTFILLKSLNKQIYYER